jgi:hypothetical protein
LGCLRRLILEDNQPSYYRWNIRAQGGHIQKVFRRIWSGEITSSKTVA